MFKFVSVGESSHYEVEWGGVRGGSERCFLAVRAVNMRFEEQWTAYMHSVDGEVKIVSAVFSSCERSMLSTVNTNY
jgi:hypothetical protein